MGNSLLWWALVFSSQLAGTRAQGIPAGLQESSSGGLNGKIIGLGNGYGGEAHGYSKVFDGLTDTWFDCFDTDGIDIKSDCWTGLELPAPSAIGAIRFFPRGNCPGCQTGGNPACVQLQKEHGKADQGACRMPPPPAEYLGSRDIGLARAPTKHATKSRWCQHGWPVVSQ